MTKVNRSRSLRAAVVAGVMALLLGPAAAAQAAVVPVNFNLTGGTLVVGGLPLEFPTSGASLAGDWDDESGDFSGALTVPTFSIDVEAAPGVSVPAVITITATPVVGTVPPDQTVGSVSTSLTVGIDVTGLAVCSLGPIDLTLQTSLAEIDGAITLTATAAGFLIPAATCDPAGIAGLVNDTLGLPTESTSVELVGVLGDAPPPAPEPEPVTPEEAEAIVVAEAAAAAPRFTG